VLFSVLGCLPLLPGIYAGISEVASGFRYRLPGVTGVLYTQDVTGSNPVSPITQVFAVKGFMAATDAERIKISAPKLH
jgi:hypothetical protein